MAQTAAEKKAAATKKQTAAKDEPKPAANDEAKETEPVTKKSGTITSDADGNVS